MTTLNTTITINADLLRACAQVAPKADKRHYMNGVLLTWDGRDTLNYVATDGNMLVAFRETQPENDVDPIGTPGEPWEMIIPRDVAAKAVPANRHVTRLSLTPNGTGYVLGLVKGADMLFVPVDGKFPDWRRIIPTGDMSGELAQFNPDYLATAMNGLGAKGTMLWDLEHNGPFNAGRIVTPDGIAVIMPYRASGPIPMDDDTRDWIRGYRLETAQQPEAAEAIAA